ncbi:hypothetical protein [Pelagicoccus mobilis]|uniref:SatD family (SatD) n=1 Tax=Pelagicoccus mobilis TaxID=415221 RepID=A0A934RUL1_9BACT|nr:hypothetical protein [Pelagicoccus mobilis]MBK1876716.1 hypothetical protein [Pelagicoccus mobilis]
MIAVLTGDIVGSQSLAEAERDQLQAYLEDAVASTDVSASIEVFAGDSWQCHCHPAHSAIRLAVTLRSYLLGKRNIDTRVSIGIGSYEKLRPEKISLSQGEAFVLSGRGLQEMPDDRRLNIRLGKQIPPSSQGLIYASLLLLNGITSDWTNKQAQAVALASNKRNQYELAEKFDPPISAQAFGKHLAKAQWKLINESIGSLESSLQQLLAPHEE